MEKIKDFISSFMIAVSNCSLYSPEHEAFDELSGRTFSKLYEIMKERLEIMLIDDELIINGRPFRETSIHKANFIKRFKRHHISRVDFVDGVTLSEIKRFIADMTETGKELKSCPHIKVGSVEINLSGLKVLSAGSVSEPCSSPEEMNKVKDIFHAATPFKKLNTAGIEEIVINFVANFKKESDILSLLSPVKSYSEYTYTHATNVGVLSVFQAEALGIKDDLLHEIGIAALLHDVGKMFISKDILNKTGKLDDEEFNEIKKHSLHGAQYLSKIDNLTKLASIIAFEHHLKYDGSGYPGFSLNRKKQHFCSRIVAIADFYDALRSRRPYRESIEPKKILGLMDELAGKEFDPFLVKNFIRLMQVASVA